MNVIPRGRKATRDEVRRLMSEVSAEEYRKITTEWLNVPEPDAEETHPPYTGLFMVPYDTLATRAFFEITHAFQGGGYRYVWEPYRVMIREFLEEGMESPYPEPRLSDEDQKRLNSLNVALALMEERIYVDYVPYRRLANRRERGLYRENPSEFVNKRPFQVKMAARSQKSFSTIDALEHFISEINL